MDHVHTPEEDANEERSVKPEGKHWSVLDSVDKAISGIFRPHPEKDANSEDKAHLREENDADQRR